MHPKKPNTLQSTDGNVAAIEIQNQKYHLSQGFHLVGRRCKLFKINNKTVDDKHALIWISNSGHQIIDLESTHGTFIENEKVINSAFIPNNKICFIKLGNFKLKYYTMNQSDSGYLDNKIDSSEHDDSEIINSSPEHSRQLTGIKSRIIRNRRIDNATISSTPNRKDSQTSQSNSKKSDDNSEFDKIDNSALKKLGNTTNDSEEDTSLFVPETQQFIVPTKKSKNVNIFDTVVDESIQQYLNDMSKDDEFFVPETQEIFLNTSKQKKDMICIDAQDFNDMSSDSFHSENLCPYIGKPKVDSSNVSKINAELSVIINVNGNNFNKTETEDMTQLKWNETEINSCSGSTTPDIGLNENVSQSSIKNQELKTLSSKDERGSTSTLDLIFDYEENLNQVTRKIENANETRTIRDNASTPDLEFDDKEGKNKNNQASQGIQPERKSPAKKTIKTVESQQYEFFNDFMDDDDLLIPTQPFFPEENDTNSFDLLKRSKISTHLNEDDQDLLDETVIFENPNKVKCDDKNTSSNEKQKTDSNKIIVETKKNIHKSSENITTEVEEIPSTQLFIPPVKKTSISNSFQRQENQNWSKDKSNSFEDLAETQSFVVPKNLKNKKTKKIDNITDHKVSENDDLECTQAFDINNIKMPLILNSSTKENPKPNSIDKPNNLKSKNKIFGKNADLSTSKLKKNVNESNFVTPRKSVSGGSGKSVDADFMLDICTPSIDLIKLPVHKQDYINVVDKLQKKPINRIFIEETDEEDDEIDYLQNVIEENENTKKQNEINKEKNENLCNKNLRISDQKSKECQPRKNTRSCTKSVSNNSNSAKSSFSEETPDFLDNLIPVEVTSSKHNLRTRRKPKFIMEEAADTPSEINQTEILKMEEHLKKNAENDKSQPHDKVRKGRTRKNSIKSVESSEGINSENKSELSEEIIFPNRRLRNKRKLSSSNTQTEESENSPSSPSHSKRNKMTVAFTKVNKYDYIETLNNIGYEVVKDPEDANLIITNNSVSRTWKFLIGLAKGIPIISVDWLKSIQEKNFSPIPYDGFYVRDTKAEEKFNFSLRETINSAMRDSLKPIFKNFNFIVTENTVPKKSEIERIIICAGGQIVDSVREHYSKNLYAVSDKKDFEQWPKLKKNYKNIKIIKTEGILLSIMQHRIRFEDHIFG